MRSRRALPVLTAVLLGALHSGARAEEEIRMAVARVNGLVSVSGTDLAAEDIVTGDVLAQGKRVITVGADDAGLTVMGKPTRARRVIIGGKEGVAYGGRLFRGRLEALFQKVRGRSQVLLVHPLPLETYLVGIVSGELPPSWPLEAMKAQAVAARTYAVYQKFHAPDRPYHMESGVLDQVYGGVQRENATARAAVAATTGQVLTWRRRPIRAYFHACCGDTTESAEDGWGTTEPYLKVVACGFCKDCGRYTWTLKLTPTELGDALREARLDVGAVQDVTVPRRTRTGRAAMVAVAGSARTRTMHAEDLRRILGYDRLRSRMFTVKREGGNLVFDGKGSGHAVGLCQWGARGMGQQGMDYRTILGRYYSGARIMRMY
ncbi:MAG: SpoIID/LytB domain-containing protein [Deltaproteobacteria bacterium]|nr:SpoIID/LytB domain-containing protein [Deltaproteobacteria bacterium]